MSELVIEAESLSKKYEGKDILREVSFSIDKGEIFGLIGPSGSGKSTLIRLLDLLEMPAGGKLSILGTDALASRSRYDLRNRMALLNQKPVIFNRSVYDNIALGMKYRKKSNQEIKDSVHDVLEVIGLDDYGNRMARTLSGGEAQRVALARSIVTKPEILFLDEPTANLDPHSTKKIEELVQKINREYNTTIVLSTHDMLQGQKLATRIGVILDGKILQIGTTNEIFHKPATTNIAMFVGVENIFSGTITGNKKGEVTIDIRGMIIQAVADFTEGYKVGVLFRAEDVTIHLVEISKTSARNIFKGKIKSLIPTGPFVNVVIDCGQDINALITISSAEELGLSFGKQVWISIKATAVHVISDSKI
jgi:tungstate transport system ATP-binding protein